MMHGKTIWKLGITKIAKASRGFTPGPHKLNPSQKKWRSAKVLGSSPGLRMKDWHFWGLLKNLIFKGWGGVGGVGPFYWANCIKSWSWTGCRFKGWLGKKKGVMFFRGVDTPMHTMVYCWSQLSCCLGRK